MLTKTKTCSVQNFLRGNTDAFHKIQDNICGLQSAERTSLQPS